MTAKLKSELAWPGSMLRAATKWFSASEELDSNVARLLWARTYVGHNLEKEKKMTVNAVVNSKLVRRTLQRHFSHSSRVSC